MKGKWTRLEQPLSQDDKLGAVKLWERGFDTFDIARGLKVPEFQIYNGLPRWRAGNTSDVQPTWEQLTTDKGE